MSKIALALGSLAVGLLVGSLFLGSHTVTFAQSPPPPPTNPPEPGFHSGIITPGAEPRVPGLGSRFSRITVEGRVALQQIDGVNCVGCVIDADVISYAGGAYNCESCQLKADRVVLKGAALNTLNFLNQVTSMLNVPEQVNRRPDIKVAANKKNATLTFISEVQ
jgi:hypothetical protein